MNLPPRICLIGPGHISSNPRIVKEANALHEAGYRVRVISGDYSADYRPLDHAVLSHAKWEARVVHRGSRLRGRLRALKRRVCASLAFRGIGGVALAVAAENDLVAGLTAEAMREPAALFIGHYLPGLAAAARAAAHHRAALGFDSEDAHVEELPDEPSYQGRRLARERIERAYLPLCRHLTAASPGIAASLEQRYGVRPTTILNVFPLSEAPRSSVVPASISEGAAPTLYWFSQTIGPGRGLEVILDAMRAMRTPVRLVLRGIARADYEAKLRTELARDDLADRLTICPPADPAEMARLAAPHDLGLALELTQPPNRAICLTNKMFTYLLAGVPVLYSRTPAQEEQSKDFGDAALPADPDGLAARLDAYFANRTRQQSARAKAWKLGQERYNWDFEKHTFLASVRAVIEPGQQKS